MTFVVDIAYQNITIIHTNLYFKRVYAFHSQWLVMCRKVAFFFPKKEHEFKLSRKYCQYFNVEFEEQICQQLILYKIVIPMTYIDILGLFISTSYTKK
jgi:hypothetical protein